MGPQARFGVAIIITLLGAFAYAYKTYEKFSKIDANAVGGIAAGLFAVVLNGFLLYIVTKADDRDLGVLEHERGTIILAIMLILVYSMVNIFVSFIQVW